MDTLPAAPDAPPASTGPSNEAQSSPPDGDAPSARRSALDIPLARLRMSDPLRWLAAGWRDFLRCPGLGLFYGGCFAAMGWALLAVFRHAPAWTLALSAGFLLMGPFLCLGLYEASRRLEEGQEPDLGDSLFVWQQSLGAMAIFGGVLLILEMLWGRASLVVFAVSFDGMPDFRGSLAQLLAFDNLPFIVAYVAVGGVFAGLIYAVSVVSLPMILDRQVDAITAGLTSLRLVLGQPVVMLWWGACITVLVVLALLPWFLGLLVVGPVLGHASWHAYRAAVPREAAAPST